MQCWSETHIVVIESLIQVKPTLLNLTLRMEESGKFDNLLILSAQD